MIDTARLFLDFDGVLCDSLEECYQSSWLAFKSILPTEKEVPSAPDDTVWRDAFRTCRPFIRSGEDYVLLHKLLSEDKQINSQEEFDIELRRHSPKEMKAMKDMLYSVRDTLISLHEDLWMSWNPLYPGIEAALNSIKDFDTVYILSTKKASFIARILAFYGVNWNTDRILYTGSEKKLSIIEKICADEPAILIDDQVDHLDYDHPSCQCYAALWGYISDEGAAQAKRGLDLPEALNLLEVYTSRRS